eukprot:COSAG02_NODE_1163_length_14166_cov_62.952797_9_plen_87_part_00
MGWRCAIHQLCVRVCAYEHCITNDYSGLTVALLQVLNLPIVRQFLFQQGDLPQPLAARGTGGAALPEGTPPTESSQGPVDLEPHDD